MDWENTGAGSIDRTEMVSKRSISSSSMLVKENQMTDQFIGDLCFQSSLHTDHNPGQDVNRLIPSRISTHPSVE